MPEDVTLGELARRLEEIKQRLDSDALAAATRERLYVLQAVYDAHRQSQDDKNGSFQKDIDDLWKARTDDAKSRRSTQVIIALALLGDFVTIAIAVIGYLRK